MPTINISHKDLNKLLGKPLSLKKIEDEALLYVKGELEEADGDNLKIEIAETNRPELWSTEGIARELRAQYKLDKGGLPIYKVKPAKLKVIVDPGLKNIRPHTVCAVVRKVRVTEDVLLQIIQLQEKVCDTFGRKREQVAIGVYDFTKIKGPIHYKAMDPDKVKFMPLEFTSEMTLRQILSRHPKGQEYGHLLTSHSKFPIFIDSADQILSMPPIINSHHTGRVTEETEDLFIECSGFHYEYLIPALHVMVSALAERGGSIEAVEIVHGSKKLVTPDFKPNKIDVKHSEIESMAGMKLSQTQVVDLLKRSRYDVTKKANEYECKYPAYRRDIMHPVDVVEDVLVSYGYNQFIPELPKISMEGKVSKIETFNRHLARSATGLGAQEILSYTLTNKEDLFKKMNNKDGPVISIENPVSSNWSVFRTSLLPGLLEFLSKNANQEYPQQIFEIGTCVIPNSKEETKAKDEEMLAWAYAGKDSDFTKAKQSAEAILRSLDLDVSTKKTENQSLIAGRAAELIVNNKNVGYVGEVNPAVLEHWGINQPICCMEINTDKIMKITEVTK